MPAYARWNASCRRTWNSRAQLRLGPVFPSAHFDVQRSSFYSQSRCQAMTTCGVALHRPIELWLQHAGQSFCSMYDGFDTTDTVLFERIRKSEDYTS